MPFQCTGSCVLLLAAVLLVVSTYHPGVEAAAPASKFVLAGNYTLLSIYNYTWVGFYQNKAFTLELSPIVGAKSSSLLDPVVYSYTARFRAGNRIATTLKVTRETQVTSVGAISSTRMKVPPRVQVVESFLFSILPNLTSISLGTEGSTQALQLSGPTGVLKWSRVNNK